ncbi:MULTISPECIES: hypothetical protein [unclassified Achromobacter]|uniref:hypothetical protein n=1 Tax=unclassified Achromobacter TaxID=2626865 RepID=UPI001178BDD7|nr:MULTISPECIES: hypothetical protein [unclassified Achromobacter]
MIEQHRKSFAGRSTERRDKTTKRAVLEFSRHRIRHRGRGHFYNGAGGARQPLAMSTPGTCHQALARRWASFFLGGPARLPAQVFLQ